MNARLSCLACLAFTAIALACISGPRISAADHAPVSGTLPESELIFQSSRLADLDVYSESDHNKKLGNLDNLIINAHTGRLLYGVMDPGIGQKPIIVPWSAFYLYRSPTNTGSTYWLSLRKTQDGLANGPTFESGRMPDFTSSEWRRSVDDFFAVKPSAPEEETRTAGRLTANQMIFLSSNLADLDVFNRNDTDAKLGNLDNLIVNAHTGHLLYAVLDTGFGGKNIAVPWTAFQLQKAADDDKYWLTLGKTRDELANAPVFNKDRMSDFSDSQWQQQTDRFFGVRTATRPERGR